MKKEKTESIIVLIIGISMVAISIHLGVYDYNELKTFKRVNVNFIYNKYNWINI